MLNRLILKVTKFQLPPPKRLGTVVKNIFGRGGIMPPMSNRVKENEIDIVAVNETFLSKKLTFRITVYDTIRIDRSTGQGEGAAFLVKQGLVINKEYRNSDFSIITSNEALAINLDISNNQNLTLATIGCPNGNPNFSFFQSINNLSDNVIFIGDFNSKLESFGCAKKNPSGLMLKIFKNNLTLFT